MTPVIALLTDLSILDVLEPNEGEVDAIFEHPLEAILDPSHVNGLLLAEKGSEDWPYEEELYVRLYSFISCLLHDISLLSQNTTDRDWLAGTPYRMHRFRSVASPVKGLTADILVS